MDGLKGMNANSPPGTPNSFSRPRPRPQRSPSQAARIRVQNRRREYLEKNPKYFTSAEQEFADPELYDKFVRKFQSPAEREAEGRSRGWGKTLESSLMRGEAKLERIASSYTGDRIPASSSDRMQVSNDRVRDVTNFSIDVDLVGDKPATKEEGRAAWDEFLRERFVRGRDDDFDYSQVDGDEDLDSLEHMDREEAYFDEEEPEWADDSAEDEEESQVPGETDNALGDRKRPKRERVLLGQTGIQDY
ncbi:hypothetical protein N0V93_009063 [Gnomoniopsis smithogilvyi]|uniref:CCD97-like C-terminal domain-containing protein n=1 Tax=Gnomoniopsis smithogilvyi TaxID=1191159 RepID=A0A9W9CSC6_9PEZI|nr:hypothetical protein N0V93_009063 [Gnomoniopsis smithogilvyi]